MQAGWFARLPRYGREIEGFFYHYNKNFLLCQIWEISGAMRYRATGLKFFGAYSDRKTRVRSLANAPPESFSELNR